MVVTEGKSGDHQSLYPLRAMNHMKRHEIRHKTHAASLAKEIIEATEELQYTIKNLTW